MAITDIAEQDVDLLRVRVHCELIRETVLHERDWKKVRKNLFSTVYRITAPLDGEDYNIVMRLMRRNDGSFVLYSHETGLFSRAHALRSEDYGSREFNFLNRLGELVFSS